VCGLALYFNNVVFGPVCEPSPPLYYIRTQKLSINTSYNIYLLSCNVRVCVCSFILFMCVRMYLYALGSLRGPFEGGEKSHYRRVYVFRRKRKHWIFIASRECLSISKAQGRPNPFDVFAAMIIIRYTSSMQTHTH